jgi:hypothetical protein
LTEEAVGGELAAAVVGDDGQLAAGDQLGEDLADPPVAQAGFPLQRGLVDAPLAARVGVQSDGKEDDEVGAFLARGVENSHGVLKAQGRHPA